jgi:hypothetical protein
MVIIFIRFGFLPVIAWLVAGSLFGSRPALWTALAVGAFEVGWLSSLLGAPDWPGIAAFALLAVLVLASLRTGDDIWFKIHWPLLSIAAALALIVAWHGFDRALLLDAAVEAAGEGGGLEWLASLDPRLTPDTVAEMLRLLSLQLPWWLLLHALFTLFAAINWGRWTWAVVRVPGFLFMIMLASGFIQGAVLGDARPKPAAPADSAGKAVPPPAAPQGTVK